MENKLIQFLNWWREYEDAISFYIGCILVLLSIAGILTYFFYNK